MKRVTPPKDLFLDLEPPQTKPALEIPSAAENKSLRIRWASLDALRGVAALVVFLFHYFGMTSNVTQGGWFWETGESLALMSGSMGTNLLLLLSGFFVGQSLLKPDFEYWGFLRSKMERLYRPYLVVMGAALLFWALFPSLAKEHPGESDLQYVLHQLVLIPGLFPDRPVLTVSWTLSYIFGGYCLLPLFAASWRRLMPLSTSLLPLWAACVLLVLCCNLVFGKPLNRISYIPAGCLLAELISDRDRLIAHRRHLLLGGWLALVLLSCRLSMEAFKGQLSIRDDLFRVLYSICGLGSAGAITMMAISMELKFGKSFTSRLSSLLRFIGQRGYSVYLLHGPVTKVLVKLVLATMSWWLADPLRSTLLCSFALALTLILSHYSYLYVENGERQRLWTRKSIQAES